MIVTRLKARGHQAKAYVVKGHPGGQITRLARDISGPLVITTTRGSSGLTRWVVGCTADNVIRTSGVPVLAVPPKMMWPST
jgi:nucleotide-binding universal stress UspA family protein